MAPCRAREGNHLRSSPGALKERQRSVGFLVVRRAQKFPCGHWLATCIEGICGARGVHRPLKEELAGTRFSSFARLRFLIHWARMQLWRLEIVASRSLVTQQRKIVSHVIEATWAWAVQLGQSPDDGASQAHLLLLAEFLQDKGTARIVRAINIFSAYQIVDVRVGLKDSTVKELETWYTRVLPTLAAFDILALSFEAKVNSACLELAAWSREFLQKHPQFPEPAGSSAGSGNNINSTTGGGAARSLSPSVIRHASAATEYQSCASENSFVEFPPSGIENEEQIGSDVEEEDDKDLIGTFRSMMSWNNAAVMSSGLPPRKWEFRLGADVHGFDQADATCMKVRGPQYPIDKKKVNSPKALFELVHVDLCQSSDDADLACMSEVRTGLVQQLRQFGEDRFLFIVNFRMPPLHFVCAFAAQKKPVLASAKDMRHDDTDDASHQLLHSFISEMDDKQRRARFKVIPCVTQGPWFVKAAMGTTPAILGKALSVEFYQLKDDYFEVSVDIFSSGAAQRILGLLKGAAKSLCLQVFFVLEGQSVEELPERILGGVQVAHVDLTRTRGPLTP